MFKNLKTIFCSGLLSIMPVMCVMADDFDDFSIDEIVVENVDEADVVSANALLNYDASGSMFERITNLEQEKVVMQLEKERAQLDLELERLNAEKIKLQMELDTLSGRAEQQQQELEMAKAQLEAQTEKIRRQQEMMERESFYSEEEPVVKTQEKKEPSSVTSKYKLVNVIGVGNQLQATIEEISTGQNKRIMVGKVLDGYTVKSISLNDGIIFEKDGVSENLNIGK